MPGIPNGLEKCFLVTRIRVESLWGSRAANNMGICMSITLWDVMFAICSGAEPLGP
jgi:hypothetical protein